LYSKQFHLNNIKLKFMLISCKVYNILDR
jgi:hypothetical protein